MSEINLNDDAKWQLKRAGKVTASIFGEFVKREKDGSFKLSSGKVAEDLIYKIAWERLVLNGNITDALNRVSITSKATEHGVDNEGAAVYRYQQVTGVEVNYTNKFVELGDWVGGTPDGYIGEDGLIEIKCPFNGGNHLKALLKGEIYNSNYVYQIQGYLWLTGRKWCDFVSFDPDMPEGLDIAIIRVERDEDVIKAIKTIIDEVIERLKDILNNKLLVK